MAAPTHRDAGARALHALPPGEAAAFDQHIDDCESCAAEYAEFLETAAMLAAATAEAPPESLRQKVLQAASRTAQVPPLTAAEASDLDGGGQPATRAPRSVRGRHNRPRAAWWQRPLPLVAAAAAAVLVLLGVVVATLPSGTSPQQVAAACIASAPDAQVRHPSVGTGGSVELAQSCDAAVVDLASMPSLPAGKAYQLWVMAGSNARSAGMVAQKIGPDGEIIVMPLRPSDTDIGISVEPSGGSKAPTTKPVWVVPLRS